MILKNINAYDFEAKSQKWASAKNNPNSNSNVFSYLNVLSEEGTYIIHGGRYSGSGPKSNLVLDM